MICKQAHRNFNRLILHLSVFFIDNCVFKEIDGQFHRYKDQNLRLKIKNQNRNKETVLSDAKDLYRLKMNEATMGLLTRDELKKVHQENVSLVISQCTPLKGISQPENKEFEKTLQDVMIHS
jgi:hypothetical protein